MTQNIKRFAVWVLALSVGCCGHRGTLIPDVHVRLTGQRSPHLKPNARLAAAAEEVRDLLGHALTVEFDPALAPNGDDALASTLIPLFEELARLLVLSRRKDAAAFIAARRLTRILVKYVPGATGDASIPRLERDGTLVVPCTRLQVGIDVDISRLLTGSTLYDPEPVPPVVKEISVDEIHAWSGFQTLPGTEMTRRGNTPEETRISAIMAVLEKSLGHALTIGVDPAIVPESRRAFLTHGAAALDRLAQYFAEMKQEDPLFHAFIQRQLKRVVLRYRASSRWDEVGFDDASGTLVYHMRWFTDWLPYGRRGLFVVNFITPSLALRPAFIREMHARFSGADDRKLELEDIPLYHEYLGTLGKPVGGAALLSLELRTRGTAIHGAIERSTAEMAAWLSLHPTSTEYATLRREYSAWIASRIFTLDADVRREIQSSIFSLYDDAFCSADPCTYLPELDRTGLAISLLERAFLASNHAYEEASALTCIYSKCAFLSYESELEYILDDLRLFDFLTASAERAERLVGLLSRVSRRDFLVAALVRTARTSRGSVSNLFAALAMNGGPFYADALRIAMDPRHELRRFLTSELLAEAKSRWFDRPDMRPLFLVVLVEEFDGPWHIRAGDITQLSRLPGLDAILFANFLDEGPRSVELAVHLLPVLKDVPTPFEIVASRLPAYLSLKRPAGVHTTKRLVELACKMRDMEGFRVLRSVLEKLARSGNQDAAALVRETRFCTSGVVSSLIDGPTSQLQAHSEGVDLSTREPVNCGTKVL